MTKCETRQTMTMSENNKVAINAMERNLQQNTFGLPETATILNTKNKKFTFHVRDSVSN